MKDDNSPAIDIRELEFAYSQSTKPLLKIDQWQVGRGQQVFLQGASGCGKTTLLNLLSGLLTPNAGELNVLGQNLVAMPASKRDYFRAQHIGFVHQQFNLIPYLSVFDNLRLATSFAKKSSAKEDLQSTIKNLLKRLQLPDDVIQRQASNLSVGQQQRIAIARALINKPEIIIADEPTSALDSDAKLAFIQLLQELVTETQSTLLFVSHDYSLATQFDQSISLMDLNSEARQIAC